jgi:hypothetical protein
MAKSCRAKIVAIQERFKYTGPEGPCSRERSREPNRFSLFIRVRFYLREIESFTNVFLVIHSSSHILGMQTPTILLGPERTILRTVPNLYPSVIQLYVGC